MHMTQVSKYPLSKLVEEQMFELIWQTVADLKTKENAQKFLYDLLTPTERIMLAKRLAIALLLTKSESYVTIKRTLKVSTSTIVLISNWLKTEGEGFRMAIEKILAQQAWDDFWGNLEEKLVKVIPPPKGSDWKRIRREEHFKRVLRRQKRSAI